LPKIFVEIIFAFDQTIFFPFPMTTKPMNHLIIPRSTIYNWRLFRMFLFLQKNVFAFCFEKRSKRTITITKTIIMIIKINLMPVRTSWSSSEVDFTIILCAVFTHCRSQKRKKDWWLDSIFCAFEICAHKDVHI